jgi:KaiC/GvpD/RAD55 family RecA-like ATPase
MLDARLVSAAIESRDAYEKVAPWIVGKDMTPPAAFWWKHVEAWYERDPQAKSVDKDLLRESVAIPNPKHREGLYAFLVELPESDSPANAAHVALLLQRRNAGLELSAAIASNDEDKARSLLPRYQELMDATELRANVATRRVAAEWGELDKLVGEDRRVPILPSRLNVRLGGGALPGHHILLFARPEAGKTTVALNMAAGFLKAGQKVLYVGNEDSIDVLKQRMLCRLTGMTEQEVSKDRELAYTLARQRAPDDKFRMVHLDDASVADVRAEVEDFGPTVLFIDQIRNLRSSEDEMTRKLERVAIEVRALLSEHQLIGVSVTQANDRSSRYSERPPVWLTMTDVDSSRTGLPAQADLMVGIGYDDEMYVRNQRALSLPKNKLSASPDAKDGVIVELDVQRGIVT